MEHPFGAMLSGDLQVAAIIIDANARISYFGEAAESLTGFKSSEIVGRHIKVLLPDIVPDEENDKPPGESETYRIRCADGSARTVLTYRHPIPQTSGLPATLVLGIDVAESYETEISLGLLHAFFKQATFGFVILDTQLRYVAVNEALARLNHRPALDHIGRPLKEVIDSTDMTAYEDILCQVLETGDPVVNMHMPTFPTAAPGNPHVMAVSWYRIVDATGRPIGLCGTVMDVTEREHALLDANRSRDRLNLLSAIGAQLGSTLDYRETAHDLSQLLVREYCDLVTVDVIHEIVSGEEPSDILDENTLVSRIGGAARETSPEADGLLHVVSPRPASESAAFAQVLMTNQPQLLLNPDAADTPSLVETFERKSATDPLDMTSVLVAPLRARDTTLGALTCVRFSDRDPFTAEDIVLLKEIANRAALSIDNSRLYRDEKQAALTLQLSLLPQRLPELSEARLTYRYQPNRINLHAGGDWFDTIVLPGRRVVMVVGDVAGHGIHSAAAMGHYRTAVRSLASIGLDPAMLLTRLNDLALDFSGDVTATCIYAVYDPAEHWCTIASAGHLPPVIARPDDGARAFEVRGGPLLGALPDAEYQETSLATPPGTRLLLYSDGLVESRTAGFDPGIDNLVRRMRSERPAGELLDLLMTESPSTEDDRTVLLAEFLGLNTRHRHTA